MARLNSGPRSNESPMDYKYDNGTGPVDKASPFVQTNANLPFQNSFAGQKRMSIASLPHTMAAISGIDGINITGPSSELDSPTKAPPFQLRQPEGQTHLFHSLPAYKTNHNLYRGPSAFVTPRKPALEADDTSGAEQSSPAYADSEATPDPPSKESPTKSAGSLVRFEGNKSDKEKSSNFSKSGKGEIAKRGTYTDILKRKVEKRRRRTTDRDVHNAPRRASNDSDSEERPSSSDGPEPSQQRQRGKRSRGMGFVPSVLTFIDAHPTLPNTLSYYVQFFINCVFALVLIYILYCVGSTIKHDINERAMMESSEILAEMSVCARKYKENRCERDTRVPAMEAVCHGWEKCMARDPYKVGRSRLSAGMFAEIFNSFIEPISIKALVSTTTFLATFCAVADCVIQLVSVSVIIGCFAVNNLTFGIYRSRHNSPPPPVPSQPAYMHHAPPPPTPQQLGYATPGYGLPLEYRYPAGIPQGHNPFEQFGVERDGSPSKRLEYR